MLGVPGLAMVLPDGIRAGSVILIVGSPGSGKTLLAMQLLMEMHWLRKDKLGVEQQPKAEGPAIFLSADENPHVLEDQRDRLLNSPCARHLKIGPLFSFGDLLPQGNQEASPAQDDDEALELFLATLIRLQPEVGKRFCAIGLDGVGNVRELRGASLRERRHALRRTAETLRDIMKMGPQTSLAAVMTAELPTTSEEVGVSQLEEYVADVVIRLGVRETSPGKVRRYLQVPKARYVNSVLGHHSLWIMSQEEVDRQKMISATLGWSKEAMDGVRKGVVVFPRMRWVRARGTGPFSGDVEGVLLSLREHLCKKMKGEWVSPEAVRLLEDDGNTKLVSAILRGRDQGEIDSQKLILSLFKVLEQALHTNWRWPTKKSDEEVRAAEIRPPKRLGAELARPGAFPQLPERWQKFLRGALTRLLAQKLSDSGTLRLSQQMVVELRHLLRNELQLSKWSDNHCNAAVMALLEILAWSDRHLRKSQPSFCSFGIRGLDEMFGTENGARGVTRGSSTVLAGGPGAGKSMLAYCFMLQGLWGEEGPQGRGPRSGAGAVQEDGDDEAEPQQPIRRGPAEDVVFLSFDERHKRVLRDAGRLAVLNSAGHPSPTVSEMAARQILQSDIRVPPKYPRFRFVYENPMNVDLDRLIYFLGREIESLGPPRSMLAGHERRRCRLIVDSLSDLERGFGDQRVFNAFVTTLLNKAVDWDVTTLLLYEAPSQRSDGMPFGGILSYMADNVVVLRHVRVNNITRKSVHIRKARGRNHDPSVAELVFVPDSEGSFHLEIRKGFEGMSNVLSGQPTPARIDLRLFAENEPEIEWNRKFLDDMEALYKSRVHLIPFRLEQIRAAFWHRLHERDITPDADVTIVSLDQPWVRTLAAQESPLLSRWDPREAGTAQQAVVRDLFADLRDHAAFDPDRELPEQRMLALPFYHDLGMFLRRTDLLGEGEPLPTHWSNVEGDAAKTLNPTSFETVLDRLLGPNRDRLGPGVCGFAFDMETVDSVACVFIEMCWNFGTTEAFLVEQNEAMSQLNLDRATEALLFLARLRWAGLLPCPCTMEHCAKAVYARLWYANLPNLRQYGGKPEHMEPQPFLLSVPGGVGRAHPPGRRGKTPAQIPGTGLTPSPAAESPKPRATAGGGQYQNTGMDTLKRRQPVGKDGEPRCCCGAWYLGVLSSGGNASLGWSIVLEALDSRRVRERALAGAGLPAMESFYRLYGDRPVPFLHGVTFEKLRKAFFRQARSRMLAFGLGSPPGDGNVARRARMDVLYSMPEALHELVMRVLADRRSHPEKGNAARTFIRAQVARVFQGAGAKLTEADAEFAKRADPGLYVANQRIESVRVAKAALPSPSDDTR